MWRVPDYNPFDVFIRTPDVDAVAAWWMISSSGQAGYCDTVSGAFTRLGLPTRRSSCAGRMAVEPNALMP